MKKKAIPSFWMNTKYKVFANIQRHWNDPNFEFDVANWKTKVNFNFNIDSAPDAHLNYSNLFSHLYEHYY